MSPTTWTPPTPNSQASDSPSEQLKKPSIPKKRGRVACLICRRRKVRCDVSTGSTPCTNCRLDQVECTVTQSSRRWKPRASAKAVQRKAILLSREWMDWEQTGGVHDYCFHSWSMDTANQRIFLSQPVANSAGEAASIGSWRCAKREDSAVRLLSKSSRNEFGRKYDNSFQCERSSDIRERGSLGLPPYILPCQQKLSQRQIEYLRDKGSFNLPESHLRDSLIHTYMQIVYPHLPVIDIAEFSNAITSSDGNSKVSLLLLQAIYYSATGYVSMDILSASGFPSRSSARKTFFDRARSLFDAAFELDTVTVVQALLHMSSWVEDVPSKRHAETLSIVAAELANEVRMHYPLQSNSWSIHDQRTWRRTWWCCVAQNYLMKLGHVAPSIRMHDAGIPTLEISDFKLSRPLPDAKHEEKDLFHLVRDGVRRAKLAKACIAMARLCTIEIPQCHRRIWRLGEEEPRSVKGSASSFDLSAWMCARKKLETWHSEFHQEIQYFMTDSTELHIDSKATVLQQGILYSLYFALVSILHRSAYNSRTSIHRISGTVDETSLRRSRDAGRSITIIYHRVLEMDLMQFIPHTVVNILAEASTTHLLAASSGSFLLRPQDIRHLRSSALALRCLSDLYPLAGKVYEAILKALSHLSPGIPLTCGAVSQQRSGATNHENTSQMPEVLPKFVYGGNSTLADSPIEEEYFWASPVRCTQSQGPEFSDTSPSAVNTPPTISSDAETISAADGAPDHWQIIFDELVDIGEPLM